jgi:hypothetical protein
MTIAPEEHDAMRSNLDLIGRTDVVDYEAIFSVVGVQEENGLHAVDNNCQTLFTWDYTKGARPGLDKLYEKSKKAQWNGQTDLPWDTEVDSWKLAEEAYTEDQSGFFNADLTGTVVEKWGKKEWIQFGLENQKWSLSQFMHGEQGALVCTAKIVETTPWIDAKYYAAQQVADEARHVEVFSKYLNEKLDGAYQMNGHLGMLLDDIVNDSNWDMTYLGMQVMVEGLALAAFGFAHQMTKEPLLKQLLRYVMADEARHVAFGILSLQEYYQGLTQAELRERQEFAFEAAVRMNDRLASQEVWERMGVPVKDAVKLLTQATDRKDFQVLLFSKIVPNCKKLGLLDAGDGWLRKKFTDLGAIAFEDWQDTTLDEDALADASPVERGLI